MFSYYGSKASFVKLYPAPKHSTIIEPFAGSARYALHYFDREIALIDASPVIIGVWNYLQSASAKDILSLPETKDGCDLRDYNLTDPERHLIYFCSTGGGAASTGFKCRARSQNCTFNNWHNQKPRIAKQLFKIRHWEIKQGNYADVQDKTATWFIDPPYFSGGHKYRPSNKSLNYDLLKNWCESRRGQVIVCENSSAAWMPFIPLAKNNGIRKKTTEMFWTNEKITVQAKLF